MSFSRPATTGSVSIDDVVDDRVDARHRATPQEIGPRLEPLPHRSQLRRIGVADGDDELRADKDLDLTEQDCFRLVHVPSGRKTTKSVSPYRSSSALVRLDSILDSELVQGEFAATAENSSAPGSLHKPSQATVSPVPHLVAGNTLGERVDVLGALVGGGVSDGDLTEHALYLRDGVVAVPVEPPLEPVRQRAKD